MNAEDPYSGLLLEMDKRAKSQQPPGLLLGTVLDVGEGRLVIQAGGMTLDEQDLMVDARLWPSQEGPFRITLDIDGASVRTSIDTGMAVITSIPLWKLPGTVTLESERLAVGDQVLLQPDAEGQIYYVLCKVVRP